jgi:ABC-2 type transport system permease protein
MNRTTPVRTFSVATRGTVLDRIRLGFQFRHVLLTLVIRDLKAKYHGSVLGLVWYFLSPLANMIVFVIVFSYFLRLHVPHYPLFLIVGWLSWICFSDSLNQSATVFVNQSNLLKKVFFPRELLPISIVLMNLFQFGINLLLLIPFILYEGIGFQPTLLLLPVMALVQTLMISGFALMVSALHTHYRDVSHILGVLLSMGFYATPVFYSIDLVPEAFRWVFWFNPVAALIGQYRDAVFGTWIFTDFTFPVLLLFSVFVFWIGQGVFIRLDHELIKKV